MTPWRLGCVALLALCLASAGARAEDGAVLTGTLQGRADGIAAVATGSGLLHGRLNGTTLADGAAVVLSIPSEAVDVLDATSAGATLGATPGATLGATPSDHRDRLPGRLVSRLLIGTAVQLTVALADGQEVTVESHVSKYPRGWTPDGVTLAWDPADATVVAKQ